jgi:hypothetical protein
MFSDVPQGPQEQATINIRTSPNVPRRRRMRLTLRLRALSELRA